MPLVKNREFSAPEYVDVGMQVIAPWKGTAIRCTVACAAGMHARVVNEKHDFSEWFYIGDLRIQRDLKDGS